MLTRRVYLDAADAERSVLTPSVAVLPGFGPRTPCAGYVRAAADLESAH
jgi:hypothetical protein